METVTIKLQDYLDLIELRKEIELGNVAFYSDTLWGDIRTRITYKTQNDTIKLLTEANKILSDTLSRRHSGIWEQKQEIEALKKEIAKLKTTKIEPTPPKTKKAWWKFWE